MKIIFLNSITCSKNKLFTSIILTFFCLILLPVNLWPAPAEYEIIRLTDNNHHDCYPQIHNGQVAWEGKYHEIFLYDGTQTTQLTDNAYPNYSPQIHNGQVVWHGRDGYYHEIFLYDGSQIIRLTDNDYNDSYPQIHNGQVVWYGYDGYDHEIFLYDGTQTIQLTDNEYNDSDPQIHDNQITWVGCDGHDCEVFLYNGIQTTQLTDNAYPNYSPQIHNGQVTWFSSDGHDCEIFLYDGTQTIQITNNSCQDYYPQIHNGQVVWHGYDGHDCEIFLYDGSQIIQITDNDYNDCHPQIHNGQVAWYGYDGHDYEIFLYDGTQTIQLTDNEHDDWIFNIHNGQVVWEGWAGNNDEIFLATPISTTFTLTEESFIADTLTETILVQEILLESSNIAGSLNGTLDFTHFETIKITTGSFAGQGFFKAGYIAELGQEAYTGTYQGTIYSNPDERQIVLKGKISGGLTGIAEATFAESTPESGIYDVYQADWKLNRIQENIVSETFSLDGELSFESNYTFLSEISLYQANLQGSAQGYYTGPLNAVLTLLRLNSLGECQYQDEGFSLISYTTDYASGQGFCYNSFFPSNTTELEGLFQKPLSGAVSALLDENISPKTLTGTIERLDAGATYIPDLKVKLWGPQRVSPGETVTYIIEYRNDGGKEAEEVTIFVGLDPLLEYISSSYSYHNEEINEIRMDLGTIAPKTSGLIRVTVEVPWGLSHGTTLENSTKICTTSEERNLSQIDTTSWRENIQPGDIVFERNDNSLVGFTGHYTHTGAVVYGTYRDHWGRNKGELYEGYFVIEALPGDGVIVNDIQNWDYPAKEEVVAIRVGNLTAEQRDYITNFWEVQIGKPYQGEWWEYPNKDSDINSSEWYCSELIWAAYYNSGIDLDSDSYWTVITPQEIYDSEFTTPIPGAGYNFRDSQINKSKWLFVIVTASDPNEKFVSPEGNIMPGDRLDYTITYENEGEGTAYGVYITDTLSQYLDDSTLIINDDIGSYNPDTGTITWLVGEVGPGGQGSLSFSINTNQDTPENTELINFATVYFPSVPEETRTNGVVNMVKTTTDTIPLTTQINIQPSVNEYGWNNTNVTITLTAANNQGGSGVKEIHYYALDETALGGRVISGSTAQLLITAEGLTTLTYWAVDNAGNTETKKRLEIKIDKTLPAVDITVNPDTLWPPNHKMIDVTIGGEATDSLSGIAQTTFTVEDEYDTIEPDVFGFNTAIQLEAWREGNDLDGRTYTISAVTIDKAGNEAVSSTTVICPHDQRKK